MTNKEIIKKLRDYAELAWASYGCFHFFLEKQSKSYFLVIQDEKGKEIKDIDNKLKIKEIYITDILNTKYKNYRVVEPIQLGKEHKEITVGTLKGDFTPTQAKNFFEKYELLDFCPKFDIKNNERVKGFHACLFQDRESKELIRKLN